LPHVKWGPARAEHRNLSMRYAHNLAAKKLSMQTITTLDACDAPDLDTVTIEKIASSPKLFVKRISDVSSTRF